MQYFLVKTEPSEWSIKDQKEQKTTFWDGVYNYQARNNMKQMKLGDLCLFYHSVKQKAVVGLVKVVKEYESYSDNEKFGGVTLEFCEEFANPVSLQAIKEDAELANIPLVRQSRLSVMQLNSNEFDKILQKARNWLESNVIVHNNKFEGKFWLRLYGRLLAL